MKQSAKLVRQLADMFPTISKKKTIIHNELIKRELRWSWEEKTFIDFKTSVFKYHLIKSSILAQDERWRRA